MGGIVRILLIVVAVVAVAAGVAFFALPSHASKTQSVEIARPAASVIARLSTIPPGSRVAEGVTQTVTGANGNVVSADLAFPEGQTGHATYTVSAHGDAASTVVVKIESPLGANPLDRLQGLTGAAAEPYLEAAVANVTTDLNALPQASFTGLVYDIVQVEAHPFLFVESTVPQDAAAIKEAVAQSLVLVNPIMQRYGLQPNGHPIAVETAWENGQYSFQAGLPFTGTPPRVLVGVRAGQTPSGTAIRVRYTGPEDNVIPTYDQMEALIAAARLEQGRSFEIYLDDPTVQGGSVNREIYYLVNGDVARLQQLAPSATAPATMQAAPATAATAVTPEAAPASAAAPASPAPATAQ